MASGSAGPGEGGAGGRVGARGARGGAARESGARAGTHRQLLDGTGHGDRRAPRTDAGARDERLSMETSLIISRQRCPRAILPGRHRDYDAKRLVRLHENDDACCVKNLSRPVRQFVAQRTDCDTSRPSQPPQRLVHQRLVLPRVDGLRPGRGRRGRGSPHVPNRATMNAVRFLVFARAAARLRR